MITLDDAWKRYGEALGKPPDRLTDDEKRAAFLDALADVAIPPEHYNCRCAAEGDDTVIHVRFTSSQEVLGHVIRDISEETGGGSSPFVVLEDAPSG